MGFAVRFTSHTGCLSEHRGKNGIAKYKPKHVIISLCSATTSRREVLEIIFEDLSGVPLTLVIGTDQAGGIPTESTLENFPLTVWTKEGLEQSHSAEFRRAN